MQGVLHVDFSLFQKLMLVNGFDLILCVCPIGCKRNPALNVKNIKSLKAFDQARPFT